MTTRRPLIAANWKMNGDLALLDSMSSALGSANFDSAVEALVCPPFTLLGAGQALASKSQVSLGAQNVSQFDNGAFTGEISVNMLQAAGCDYVLVGHSERREMFAETNAVVAEKFIKIARAGLKPVLCLGESLAERGSGATETVLGEQLSAVLAITESSDWAQAVIAYEPVWAIGTGKTATPEMAQETHAFIRRYLSAESVTADFSETMRILYGGSMKPDNAAELLAQTDIDGGLVGGASLDPESFVSILKAVS